MKKLFFTIFAVAAMTTAALAGTGIFGGYVVLDLNGSASAFYKLDNPDDNSTTPFSGIYFGLFDPSLGQSFILNGGEADTYKNGGSDVTGASLNYRVYLTGTTPGAFTSLNLAYDGELGGGDQKWQTLSSTTDLLSGLASGNYTLEVYVTSSTSDGTQYLNAGGSNYTATFSVVPEPSPIALIAGPAVLGAFFFIRRRRRA